MLRSGAEAHRWGGVYRWGEGCAGGVGGVQVGWGVDRWGGGCACGGEGAGGWEFTSGVGSMQVGVCRWGGGVQVEGMYRCGKSVHVEGCAGGVGSVQVKGAAGARWLCGSEPGSVESRVGW